MFDRLELLIGSEKLNIIKSKKVLVVGIGGVGGSSCISLVRSGINNITLIDFDTVAVSNLNRQVVAFQETIGLKKVDVMEQMIKHINPLCNINKYDLFLKQDNISEIFDREKPDYVIDACDSKDTKKAIIKECIKRNIEFITSMGTGNKLDPAKLKIANIRDTINDPLARIFRKWAKEEKIEKYITTLSSSEVPMRKGEVVASCSFVPNVAGEIIASYVINNIIGNRIYGR